jgi:sulfite exporter TauE/SafE
MLSVLAVLLNFIAGSFLIIFGVLALGQTLLDKCARSRRTAGQRLWRVYLADF